MQTVIWTAYGGPEVLELREIEKPVPAADEVLVRVHATTVFAGDCELRKLDTLPMFSWPVRLWIGWKRPDRIKVLGQEVSGVIEVVGEQVSDYATGDEIAVAPMRFGGNSEYLRVSAKAAIARKPPQVSHAQAAALIVGGSNALYFYRKARVRKGDKVLLVGAGGSIGTILLQLAKMDGADLTVVDTGEKLARLRDLGADHVIDFQHEDLCEYADRYDAVFNISRYSSYSAGLRLLREGGRLLLMNVFFWQLVRGFWASRTGRKSVLSGIAPFRREDLEYLLGLVASGKLEVVIDREYRLADVAEAHRYVDSGKKFGNVVITVAE